jgi:hypothetical protein
MRARPRGAIGIAGRLAAADQNRLQLFHDDRFLLEARSMRTAAPLDSAAAPRIGQSRAGVHRARGCEGGRCVFSTAARV